MNQPNYSSIAIDANVLVAWCSEGTSVDIKERLDQLLLDAHRDKRRIIIPTPVIAEFLVRAEAASTSAFATLEKRAAIYVAAFDRMAAFECSLIDAAAINRGDKRDGSTEPYQKIKIDRQIIAIAKVHTVGLVVTADEGVRRIAQRVGIDAKDITELNPPAQCSLQL